LEETGYAGFRQKLNGIVNSWRYIKIKIAVTGEAGAGKSTFINSIRGLKADDPFAAKVGSTETTMKPTMYPFPNRPNLELWDLPGFGTLTFDEREKYVKHVGFEDFDFILLLSAKRFTSNDAWLAGEILKVQPAHHLYFVRTQVDYDVQGYRLSTRTVPTKSDVKVYLQKIQKDCSDLLKTRGIKKCKIFLINSYDCGAYDYNKLVCKLIEKTDVLKKEAMILSLHGITNDVIKNKLEVLQGRISTVSKAAGVEAAYTNREDRRYPIEVEIMLEEANVYREQLGLNLEALEVVARKLKVDMEQMLLKMNMTSYRYSGREEDFARFYREYDKFRPGFRHYFPGIGGYLRSKSYQYQCAITLKAFLDLCAQDVRSLQTYIMLTTDGGDNCLRN